ncbi:MAG: HAD hydrolase-like protein [Bacillota bacterium]
MRLKRRPSEYAAYLLDVDGVLCRGEQVVEGAVQALERLQRGGKRLAFVSNTSLRYAATVLRRIRRLGAEVSEDKVLVAGALTAEWIAERSPGASVYVLGSQELAGEMRQSGLHGVEDPGACGHRCQYLVVGNAPNSRTPVQETLFVGDTLDTDVVAGLAVGFPTALVLTGNTTERELEASRIKPDYVLQNLLDLWATP